MNFQFDIWKMLAGVAIFLLGMSFIEKSLKQIAGRSFKLFLKKQTSHKLRAIGGGAVVTALLQSSSIVNLMILAFVGSGVIQMQSALAVMLGSNIGTTLTSWIVATAGFQLNVESFALPVTGVAGLTMMLTNKQSRLYNFSQFLFGFSFLFVGLNYMKDAVEGLVKEVDLSQFNQYPLFVFLLIGIAVTSLIQSSSATMAIILSALYVNAIGLLPAMAIALGSEIGTTVKLLIASSGGIPAKKRVALGNFLINSITSVLLFFVLRPVHLFITGTTVVNDPVIAIVIFQTFVNLFGIILFYPFLGVFGKFLEKRFTGEKDETLFIHKVKLSEPELAMAAMEKETTGFIYIVAQFNLQVFNLQNDITAKEYTHTSYLKMNTTEKYEYIKHVHGEILAFYVHLQTGDWQEADMKHLNRLVSAVRNGMYAAKNMKDAMHDVELLRNSSNDSKFSVYRETGEKTKLFYEKLLPLLIQKDGAPLFNNLAAMYKEVIQSYTEGLNQLYKKHVLQNLSEIEISTVINYNRELYSSYKSILLAAKDTLLTEKEAEDFDELPGSIR